MQEGRLIAPLVGIALIAMDQIMNSSAKNSEVEAKLNQSKDWDRVEDQYLRDNYAKQGVIRIADTLQRPVLTVRSRVRKLGLRLQGNRPVHSWGEADLLRLRQLVASGLNNVEIGKRLGKSPFTVRSARAKLGIATRQPNMSERVCLSCSEIFKSEGIHNRICDGCKESDEWQAGGLMSQPESGTDPMDN